MKSKLIALFSILPLVICSLFFLVPNGRVYSATEDKIDSYYLVNGSPYKSNVVAGSTNGYGTFPLGEEEVTLTANANAGFKLVGWLITYNDEDSIYDEKEQYIDSTNVVDGEKIVSLGEGENTVTYTLNFINEDANGDYESGTFKISRVFENISLSPVFDYVYYNLDISTNIDLYDLDAMLKLSTSYGELYYESATTLDGITHYLNSVLYTNDKYYYYQDVYSYDSDFYTIQLTATETPIEQNIPLSMGAYRANQRALVNLKIKEDLEIDIIGASILEGESLTNLTLQQDLTSTNGYMVTRAEDSRLAERITIAYDIQITNDHTSILEIESAKVYKATINITVDGEQASAEATQMIMPLISAVDYFSIIDEANGIYYVKDANANNGIAFRLTAPSVINKIIDGIQYNYYTFNTLNGTNNNSYLFKDSITEDFTINIDFSSSRYNISFMFIQYDSETNQSLIPTGNFNLEQSFTMLRGQTQTVTKTDISNNIGYSFYGFALNANSISNNTSIELTIDNDKPSDITVWMLYEKIDYQIIINNYDSIKLTYNSSDIYAINEIDFTLTRGENNISSTIDSDGLRQAKGSLTLPAQFNINDKVNLISSINNGFLLLGYKFDESQDYFSESNQINFTFDDEFITTYDSDQDNIINLFVYEDYARYSYSFYILAEADTALDKNVIMADLSITYNDATYSTADASIDNENVTVNITEAEARITISNLKLYDKLTLNATGRQREGATDYYLFVRMTENDKTNYTPDSFTDSTVTYTATILSNNTAVKVIYSMPSTLLIISADISDAYDFTKLAVYEAENEFTTNTMIYSNPNGETNIQIGVTVGSYITIKLNAGNETIGEIFNFGYTLEGYTLTKTGLEPNVALTKDLSYSFYADSTLIQRVTINIATIEYRVSVSQFYDNGVEIGSVGFGEDKSQNYKAITVEDGLIEFIMGEYIGGNVAHFTFGSYYAGKVYFIKNGEHEYTNMEQTNEYKSGIFSYTIDSDELLELSRTYDVTDGEIVYFNIKIVYSIHTYNIAVNYALTNPKNETYDGRVNFPSMILQYSDGGAQVSVNPVRVDNTITFGAIPYGVNPTIVVASNVPSGMSAFGFTSSADNTLPDRSKFIYTTTSLSFLETLADNYQFYYKLSYDSYALNTVIMLNGEVLASGGEIYGAPEILVNGTKANRISIYDSLRINMNPQIGYKFDHMLYEHTVYSDGNPSVEFANYSCFLPYQYTGEQDWNRNYLLLYTYDDSTGSYVRNTSKTYNENITYFKSNINYYEDTNFSIDNYLLSGGYITFYIEYSYADYVIINTNTNYGETNYLKENTDVQISPEQYSTFRIFTTTAEGTNEIESTDTINASARNIEIRITMNYTPQVIDGTYYDLSLGLRLMYIYMFGEPQAFTMIETGVYSFKFNFADVIDRVTDGILDITYRYQAENLQITLTTNIDSESFYYRNGLSQFVMFYHNETYNYGGEAGDNKNTSGATSKLYYLAKAEFGYTNYNLTNFEVTGVKAYIARRNASGDLMLDENGNLLKGEVIPTGQYAYYGIHLQDPIGTSFALRFITNIVVELQVQPIIRLNGAEGHTFTNTFICDNYGYGVPQKLTTGSSSGQIQADIEILQYLQIRYFDEKTGLYTDNPTNVGSYRVYFSLENTTGDESYDWMETIEFLTDVYFVIAPKEVNLTYNLNTTFTKTYDGSDSYNVDNLIRYLLITDGANLNISFNSDTEFALKPTINANITYTLNGEQITTANANEESLYNIYITGLSLYSDDFNNNFKLSNNSLIMLNAIRIMRKELTLVGVVAEDKVYNGSTNVNVSTDANLSYIGIVAGDSIDTPIKENLTLNFEDENVGANKNVIVDTQKLITGLDANNYKISNSSVKASIYPYSLTATIEGIGTFTVYNERGLTDSSKANLIPINAEFKVDIISTDSYEYANVYPHISGYLVNNRITVYGLKLRLTLDGVETNLSNDLMLSIPSVDRYLGTIWLTGEESGELTTTQGEGNILIDLSNLTYNLDRLIITQQRELFPIWQIVLIILAIVILIVIIVIVVVVLRKRKQLSYEKFDKI